MENLLFDGGRITKMEIDYEPACDENIPKAKELAKSNPDSFHEAIDILLQLEKQTRLGADMSSCSRVLVAICEICFENNKWTALNEYITLLVRRRSQLKQAVTKMVQECCTYLDKTPDNDTKTKLIDTLRNVTEGKIYVEIERARLTKILADMKEADGDIVGAAAIMEQLQVETYGSMEKREKVELILEQIRLCLRKEDYVSTQIIAKKIAIKFFDDPRQKDLKRKYYELMIELDRETSFLKTSRHYQAIATTVEPTPKKKSSTPVTEATQPTTSPTDNSEEKKPVAKDTVNDENAMVVETTEPDIEPLTEEEKKDSRENLVCAVIYCILAPFDNEQTDMMEHLSRNKKLEEIPVYKEILRLFMSKELINFDSFNMEYGKILADNPIFKENTKHGERCAQELKDRLIEHNIRIIASYYSRVHLQRMSELVNLPASKCEVYLSKLANNDTIRVKIDRPSEIIYFATKKTPSDILNNWAQNTNTLMGLVNKSCHLINKEECINSVLAIALEEA